MAKGTCSIESCERPKYQRGWCGRHYDRWRNHGDPFGGLPSWDGDDNARFWSKVKPEGECLVWTAYRKANGYGAFDVRRKSLYAHRWAYEHQVGPIPEGLVIDHLCRNRACVNVEHLEPVTQKVNVQRGESAQAKKTHCPRGHAYDEANTRIYYKNGRFHGRFCRACAKS